MTLRELSSVYYIQKEIDMIAEKIKELETQAERVTPILNGVPPSRGASDRVGIAATAISDYHRALEIKHAALLTERNRLMKYIDTIPDAQTRLIFTYRFNDLMSWQQVALKIGGNNTEDGIKKKAYRYVNTH